ncbi:MAG: 7-cyano-7-deazaguanine synthase QueC [bacterium]
MRDDHQAARSAEQSTTRTRAIVLASGGMDSLVTLAIAAASHEIALLHVDYGQRTEARERLAFRQIADHYGIERRLETSVRYLAQIGGSSLTEAAMPVRTSGIVDGEPVPDSYVPFRNTHLIAIAVSWGEVISARRIFVGAVEEDSSGYPDCRGEYFEAMNRLIAAGTRPESRIEVVTPLIALSKREIVERGAALGAPFALSWSCYQREDAACGVCDSCRLRLRAFRDAGLVDPIPYANSAGLFP